MNDWKATLPGLWETTAPLTGDHKAAAVAVIGRTVRNLIFETGARIYHLR